MAEYSNLSATINAQIRANGVQAITGPVLNAVLTAMVNVLGDGYRLKGVAAPADNPGSPDNRVAYLAAQDGTYTNFGGLAVSGEVALLLWDSAWTKATLVSIDAAVTPGSDNLITSGAVDSALAALATQYMALVPTATEGNLAEFDNAGQVRDAGLATSDLATKDGHYPDLFAGFAGNLVDTRSAGTRQSFAFRQSGGDGVNYMRKILGRTEAFNQMLQNGNFADSSAWTVNNANLSVAGGVGTVTPTGIDANISQTYKPIYAGHKYFVSAEVNMTVPSTALQINVRDGSSAIIAATSSAVSGWQKMVGIATAVTTKTDGYIRIYLSSGTDAFSVRNFICIDLTLEYGAGNEPATVAEFEALHPLPYYNYNAGVLKNNAATGLETVGFNQWDEVWEAGSVDVTTGEKISALGWIRSKNFIPCIPNTTYYFKHPLYSFGIRWYDAAQNYIGYVPSSQSSAANTSPSNCAFMLITMQGTTYNHDICINRSDASRNGTYEPYWKREIVLGLNNLPCHDENNNAVVVNGLDGVGTVQDELVVENGWGTKIIKRFAEVDLGDLEWSYMSGGNKAFRASISGIKAIATGETPNMICATYATLLAASSTQSTLLSVIGNMEMRRLDGADYIYARNDSYSDAAIFKAAMAGVKLRYELATPKVLTLDNPIPALIEVDNLGTEKRLPEDTADNPQAPFKCDSNYSVSTANLVRLLNL